MLNNPALLLFRSKDEDRLHFIAGSAKANYRLSNNELDYYRVYINGRRTAQKLNSLTWNVDDRIEIVKLKDVGAWYNVLQDPDWDPAGTPDLVGAQLPIRIALLEPKHWLSPLPNFLPDEKYVGILRTFIDCTTLQSVCDYLFSNMPHTNNLARVFQGCTSLTTVPQHIFDGIWENLISPSGLFIDSGLTEVPVLFYHNSYPSCTSVNETFTGTPIKNIPLNFFDRFTNLIQARYIYKNTSYLESCPISFFNNNQNLGQINELFNNSKICSKSNIVLDFSSCPNIDAINDFYSNPTNTSISINPCIVKVKRNTLTATTFANAKANSNFKTTFNLQYVD